MTLEARPRLSVSIPAWNAALTLPDTLNALTSDAGGAGGSAGRRPFLDLDIVVVDSGSEDPTAAVAAANGARLLTSADRGRGVQMATGAKSAAADWLPFLHADTRLTPGWAAEVATFTTLPDNRRRAAAFRFMLDTSDRRARRVEWLVAWRCRWLALPYGDQGLLIHRNFYQELGGFQALPLMEDVALVRKIGRRRLVMLKSAAVTSAARFERDGYFRRPARNIMLTIMYRLGVPVRFLARLYG